MKTIRGLNQFSAAANLTLFQHFLQKKKKKNCPFTFFNKATKELNKNDRKVNKYKIKNQEGMKKRKSLVQKVLLKQTQVKTDTFAWYMAL